MGSPKALLTLDGITFLSRIIEALRLGGCDSVLVVTGAAEEPGASQVARQAVRSGASVAINPDPLSEQIDSLRCALRALPDEPEMLVVTPVDSPGSKPGVIRALVESIRAGAPIAVPVFGGRRGHPVVFGRTVLRELLEPDLPKGARTVIHRHQAELAELDLGEPDVLLDIDTPHDYARLNRGEE